VDVPLTFDAWEERLVDYFLAVGPDGDATPIRALEITPSTLSLACGVTRADETYVEECFRVMLSGDPMLMESLRSGSQRSENQELPNCFSYLAFTLLIDNLIEGNTPKSGEYRLKLVKWLGVDTAVSNLRGIALMWEGLVRWLDIRIEAGMPYRRLVLPNPGSWTHIGYTRHLSFPSKIDLKLVANFCQENPAALRDLRISIASFPQKLLDERASWGLRDAFEEFRDAYFMQRRALGDLRFWRLLERASTLIGRPIRNYVTIEMLFDTDNCALFFTAPGEQFEVEAFASFDKALVAAEAEQSENLAAAALFGIVFFRLIGVGRWRAEPEIYDSVFGLHVAIAERHRGKIGDRLGLLAKSGSWAITTNTVTKAAVEDVLRIAKLISFKQELIVRPLLSGGVRTAGFWLGRPRFLPRFDSDTSDYALQRVFPRESCCPLKLTNGQLTTLRSTEGVFVIHPVMVCGEEHALWTIRLQFARNAFVHGKLAGARYKLSPLKDWVVQESAPIFVSTHDALEWETDDTQYGDLLEAIYASGQTGWEEAQIIALLRCADDVMSPWLLLRSLRDGGIVEPRLRSGWKGRVWTLREPVIIEVHRDGQIIVVVEGALCTRMVEDFKLAVEGFGGSAFRRIGITDWAVPLLGAQGVQGRAIADRLGWRFINESISPSEKPLAFVKTSHQALHYQQNKIWSWDKGCFLSTDVDEEVVRLVRLTHIGGRDHDVYRVEHGSSALHYLSHTAAIASAYALARKPMFEWNPEQNVIALTVREGGLPDALATETRRRMLRNGGPSGRDYIYPADREVVRWLNVRLPGCIAGPFPKTQRDTLSLIGITRRSSGRVRLQWSKGSATL
jgi:hypothetical protein